MKLGLKPETYINALRILDICPCWVSGLFVRRIKENGGGGGARRRGGRGQTGFVDGPRVFLALTSKPLMVAQWYPFPFVWFKVRCTMVTELPSPYN